MRDLYFGGSIEKAGCVIQNPRLLFSQLYNVSNVYYTTHLVALEHMDLGPQS